MSKILFAAASFALLSTQAVAQVRPADCRPVFPVVDQVRGSDPAARGHPAGSWWKFTGGMPLGLLIPGLFITGLIIITRDHDHHHNNVSPA